ncbi:MAG: hypothetical protein UW73_C0019G0027 [Microgenomates group bacterium GW2011_GWB1_44_8]|nr:MAG: hypothetical protein UW73_C0019G0027 [Microgenomates group bacterium GW2011_GWB1_44_8]
MEIKVITFDLDGTPQLAPIFELNEVFQTSERRFVTPPGFEPGLAE